MKQNRTLVNNSEKRHCMVVLAHYPLGETRVQREAEALLAHGYQVDVIAQGGLKYPQEDEHCGVRIYRLPFRRKTNSLFQQFINYLHFCWLAGVKLTRLHRQQPYTTVQIHNLPDFLVFCAFWLKLKGVPIILDLHDLMPEFYAGRFGEEKKWLSRLVRWQERWSCRFADHVITVSDHWRETLILRGVSPDKCSVVMNVADEKIFSPPSPDQPSVKDPTKFHLIYHGTVVYRYGLDLAVRAVKKVQQDIPGIRLTIIGGGNYVDSLEQLVQELALDHYVTIDNRIYPAEELPALLMTADLGIVPYRNDSFSDGLLPTKLMEYSALGLPAIAARTTAINRYFEDTLVEFFEPGNADDLARCIRQLYNDRNRLAHLVEGTHKFNTLYNWTKLGKAYVDLVERLETRL